MNGSFCNHQRIVQNTARTAAPIIVIMMRLMMVETLGKNPIQAKITVARARPRMSLQVYLIAQAAWTKVVTLVTFQLMGYQGI